MSRIFGIFGNKESSSNTNTSLNDQTNTDPIDETESVATVDDNTNKQETVIAKLVRNARNRFIAKQLEGTISISRLTGIFTSDVSCNVTADSLEASKEDDDDNLGYQAKEALNAMDGLIAVLLHRSKAWKGCEFMSDMTLSHSTSIGFYLPVIVTVGFSITITFTVSLKSLLAHRQRQKEQAEFNSQVAQIDSSIVEEVMAQGFSRVYSQRAVIATGNTTYEAALQWAMLNKQN
jgi:hypothetical protein